MVTLAAGYDKKFRSIISLNSCFDTVGRTLNNLHQISIELFRFAYSEILGTFRTAPTTETTLRRLPGQFPADTSPFTRDSADPHQAGTTAMPSLIPIGGAIPLNPSPG